MAKKVENRLPGGRPTKMTTGFMSVEERKRYYKLRKMILDKYDYVDKDHPLLHLFLIQYLRLEYVIAEQWKDSSFKKDDRSIGLMRDVTSLADRLKISPRDFFFLKDKKKEQEDFEKFKDIWEENS